MLDGCCERDLPSTVILSLYALVISGVKYLIMMELWYDTDNNDDDTIPFEQIGAPSSFSLVSISKH